MTLGEIIKEYVEEHSISGFIKDSGLSKAYVYMLINNKNNKGEPIVPSIETIKKVADGTHTTFEEVFNKLDYDFIVKVEGANELPPESEISKSKEMKQLLKEAKDSKPEALKMASELLKKLKTF